MSFSDKIKPARQKKMLALDGGGIRGVVALQVLSCLEDMLRETEASGRADFRLADYFDYIAGTSTGAGIAAALSLGLSVAEISHFYDTSANDMFSRAGYLRRFRYKYEQDKVAELLKNIFGADTTLGSEKLRTLLMMVMRNATTDSPWPVCNNPYAKFNDRRLADCNLDLPLWQLVLASSAAPTYFPPELVRIGQQEFLFVDGGVTTYSNPAFQLFLMATLEPYKLRWPTGADKLLLVSVGTGNVPHAKSTLRAQDMTLLYNAGSIPAALINAAVNEQDFLCRAFGDCLAGLPLDNEVGEMKGLETLGQAKLFTYMRYNGDIGSSGLTSLGLTGIRPEDVQSLDSIDHIDALKEIGQAIAKSQVRRDHFAAFTGCGQAPEAQG